MFLKRKRSVTHVDSTNRNGAIRKCNSETADGNRTIRQPYAHDTTDNAMVQDPKEDGERTHPSPSAVQWYGTHTGPAEQHHVQVHPHAQHGTHTGQSATCLYG